MEPKQKFVLSINMYAHEGSGFSAAHYQTFDTLHAAKVAANELIKTQRWCNVITRDAQGKETVHYRARKLEPLKDGMQKLVGWVWMRADEQGYDKEDHHKLFHDAAAEFDLYHGDGAPVWLSRVVAGVLQDRDEGLTPNDY